MLGRQTQTPPKDSARLKSLYFLTWRWHFYAGLFVVPFMLMLSITGLVMLFDDEIELARYEPILKVIPEANTTAPSEQLFNVKRALPTAEITQFLPSQSDDMVNRFSIRFPDGEMRLVTVNPYSGEVLGQIDRSDSWYQLANEIHGTLLMGDYGDYLIEVAASLSIILLVTGMYLWLPLDNARRAGFLRFRVSSGRRTFIRDLHSNLGGGLSLVLLFFILSGLAWAGIWGGKFVQAWSSFPAQKWEDVPLSSLSHKDLNHGSEEEMPWNLEQTPVPTSHGHHQMGENGRDVVEIVNQVNLDSIVKQAKLLGFQYYRVHFPRSETGVFTVSANTMSGDITNPTHDRTVHIDQYSGQLLADVTWNDYNLVAKAMAAGIALHQGDVSVYNKVANTLICISFIVLAITGLFMWWVRRPSGQGKLGVPPTFSSAGVWKTGVISIVIVSVLFPLAGVSIILALLVDWLLFSRFGRLKLVFS
ncbi:PepSY-associated TM helix domain-containing protein [Vibrio sp. TRT 21S02]|uniref:PepSY-associated TM helix domain-containing protein n=1 Tax=Vibrio sp. TRT 21S02 TaxID=3418507 RepID=UPI003CE73AD3